MIKEPDTGEMLKKALASTPEKERARLASEILKKLLKRRKKAERS